MVFKALAPFFAREGPFLPNIKDWFVGIFLGRMFLQHKTPELLRVFVLRMSSKRNSVLSLFRKDKELGFSALSVCVGQSLAPLFCSHTIGYYYSASKWGPILKLNDNVQSVLWPLGGVNAITKTSEFVIICVLFLLKAYMIHFKFLKGGIKSLPPCLIET